MSRTAVAGRPTSSENQLDLAVLLAGCVLVCPVSAAVWQVWGGPIWEWIGAASALVTVALVDALGGEGLRPGHLAEAFSLAIAAVLAALPPALAIGLHRPNWVARASSFAAMYPAWIAVMIAPAAVIYEYSVYLDPSLHKAHLSFNFMVAFSAASTSVALAYSIWARSRLEA